MRAFAVMTLMVAAAAVLGNLLSLRTRIDEWLWLDFCVALRVLDAPAFLRVALIHTMGYVGSLTGLIVSILYLRRMHGIEKTPPDEPPRNR